MARCHILLPLPAGSPWEGRSPWNQRKPGEMVHACFHPWRSFYPDSGASKSLEFPWLIIHVWLKYSWSHALYPYPDSNVVSSISSTLQGLHKSHPETPLQVSLFLLPGSIWTSGSSRISGTSRCQGNGQPGWEIKHYGWGRQLGSQELTPSQPPSLISLSLSPF